MLALWALMFKMGGIPSNLALLIIALLPKPAPPGGTRPIGIFPSFIQLHQDDGALDQVGGILDLGGQEP